MDVQNINKLIDHLKTQTHCGFNMGAFVSKNGVLIDHSPNHCGTTACLAGHIWHLDMARSLHSPQGVGKPRVMMRYGQQFLGLNDLQASQLFLGQFLNGCLEDDSPDPLIALENITLPQAIHCLENLRDTGEVDWKEAVQCPAKL